MPCVNDRGGDDDSRKVRQRCVIASLHQSHERIAQPTAVGAAHDDADIVIIGIGPRRLQPVAVGAGLAGRAILEAEIHELARFTRLGFAAASGLAVAAGRDGRTAGARRALCSRVTPHGFKDVEALSTTSRSECILRTP